MEHFPYENPTTPAERRHAAIIEHAQETLTAAPHKNHEQAFILTHDESIQFGNAIATRDKEAAEAVVSDVLAMAIDDYQQTDPAECITAWDASFASYYGDDITLKDLFEDISTKEAFNAILAGSEHEKLGLDDIEYCKLLETVATFTLPDTGFKKISSSQRARTGGTDRALHHRSVTLLTHLADSEPGVRRVRENILANNPDTLTNYLENLSVARYAQTSLANLEALSPYDINYRKGEIERLINNELPDDEIDIETKLHILNWQVLSGKEDRAARHRRIRHIIEDQSKTEHQKKQLAQNWCPERLDFLIEIAEKAAADGRDPSIYVSNRFEQGAGVYVAVEMLNPHDTSKKIVFADNPIAGNALYVVDEMKLANEGRPQAWPSVLGASRRIARERGATRKYHSKNWMDVVPEILLMGEKPIHIIPVDSSVKETEPSSSAKTYEETDKVALLRDARAYLDAVLKRV